MRRPLVLWLAAGLLVPCRVEAWGFSAHRLLNRKAIATLPEPLRSFLERNSAYLVEHSIDPDLQRAGPSDPDHFLDLDAFGAYPFESLPREESQHLAKHGPDAAAKGRVPWKVGAVYRELVEAFRGGDSARALERAAALGHYLGDAHVPFHSALNYDGQLSGQAGIHARWESALVERFALQVEAAVAPEAASAAGDPVRLAFDALLESFPRHLEALAADREARGDKDLAETPQDDRYGDLYYSRLYEAEGGALAARLSRAASRIGSLWLQAWQEAGRPGLDPAFRLAYVRRQAKAVLVSLDGASATVIDDAVARGVMPSLARLRARGAVARGATPPLPPKTAAAHAALYTGAWGDRNGITGNAVPVPGGSVLEWNTGYTSTHLQAEPIWVTAARQGLDATVATAVQVFPFSAYSRDRRFSGYFSRNLTLLDGYQSTAARDRTWRSADLRPRPAGVWLGPLPEHDGQALEVALEIAGATVDGLLYDDPRDPVRGLDTLYLALDRDPAGGITLKPAPARGADASAFAGLTLRLGGGDAAVYFRLFALAPDGSEILLYQTGAQVLRASKPRVDTAAHEASGGFVGNGASRAYERGDLGPPLWAGGDGTAERRYLESVALVTRQFARLTDFAIDRTPWDLLVAYLPYPDEALHAWLGRLEPGVPGHDPSVAARLRPFLDELLRTVDDFVARVSERAGPQALLAVAGDHGMMGAGRVFRPNLALARAGLLALDAAGQVDLARTRLVYFPGDSGHVLVNRVGRPGGIVRPEDEPETLRLAKEALHAARDPRTGAPVVERVLAAGEAFEGPAPGLGSPRGGDLYLELAAGYVPSADTKGEVVEDRRPAGEHFGAAGRPEMRSAFAIAGPGVAEGVDLGVIRQIDIAPTLCALLGIEPPAQSQGSVVRAALSRR